MDSSKLEAIEEMMKNRKSEEFLKTSFSIFKINKQNIISRIVIIMIGVFLAYIISCSETVIIMRDVLNLVLDTTLAVFGVVFTGYAFFQALLSGKLISVLLEDIVESTRIKSNTLHKMNCDFVQMMMQLLLSIFITLIVKVVLHCMPVDFCFFDEMWINELSAGVLIGIYLYHLMVILWRMISFIFNFYQLLNSYAITEYICYIKENEK